MNNVVAKLNNTGLQINNKWLVRVFRLIKKGEIVTLIEPNGSGKSTTKIALGSTKMLKAMLIYTNKSGYVPQKISIDWTLPVRVIEVHEPYRTVKRKRFR